MRNSETNSRRPLSLGVRAFRILLSAGLLLWIFGTIPRAQLTDAFHTAGRHPLLLILGLLCTFLALLSGSVRWWLLLRSCGLPLRFPTACRYFFMGQFFNSFLPGACGGDVARALLIVKDFPDKRTESISTVLLDRGLGLFTQVMFVALILPFRMDSLTHQAVLIEAARRLPLLVAAVLLTAILLFRKNLFTHGRWMPTLERIPVVGSRLRRAYETAYALRTRPLTLIGSVLFSLLLMIGLCSSVFCFSLALESAASFIDCLTIFPIVTVLTAIPLTPGALGVREGLFKVLFSTAGVAPARAVLLSLATWLGGLFWSVFGGLLFAFSPTRITSAKWRDPAI